MPSIESNLFTSYDSVGNREELEDAIYDISPEDTPIMSGGGRGDSDAVFHEWQVDQLAAAISTNAHLDGETAVVEAITPTTRIGNFNQISTKVYAVSGTEERINKAGRKSELAYQGQKKAAELKLDMEFTVVSNQAADAGTVGASPRKTASLLAFLKSNTVKESGGVDPVYTNIPDDDRTDASGLVAFSEANLKTALLAAYRLGAKPSRLYTGPFNKNVAAGFTGVASKVYNLNSPGDRVAVMASIDVYVSNFGEMAIIPTRLQRERDVFGLDPAFYSMVYLRPFFTKPLADIGDSTRRELIVEWGLKVHNEKAHFGIFDKTTS
jgi:hypothetical protein